MSVVTRVCSGIFYSALLSAALPVCCKGYCSEDDPTVCFSGVEVAMGVIVPPLLLSLVVVTAVILWIKRIRLIKACSQCKRSTTGHSESNENDVHMDNPTYSIEEFINPSPTSARESSPTSPTVGLKLPFYESVELLTAVGKNVPDYDVVNEVISSPTRCLQTHLPKLGFPVQDSKYDGRPISPYAVTTMTDETISSTDFVQSPSCVSQKVKEINSMITQSSAVENYPESNASKRVTKKRVGSPTKKPVCAPKPDVSLLTGKFVLKSEINCSEPSSEYSQLDLKANYASLEPHTGLELKHSALTPKCTDLENYSHLDH